MSGPTEICALCWPGCKSRLFIFYVISRDCIHSFPSNMAIFHCERNRTIIFSAGLTKCGSGSRLIDLANSYNTARDCIHSHLAKWHFFSFLACDSEPALYQHSIFISGSAGHIYQDRYRWPGKKSPPC